MCEGDTAVRPVELPFERSFRRWCEGARVEWRTTRYARPEAGGETFGHRFSPAAAARGAVLVVHGGGNDALFVLTGLFSELLGRDFEVFSFDVDGHGRGNTTSLSAAAASTSIESALEEWGERIAGLPLHTIGISLGGSILLHSLPRLRRRVASAALLCAPMRVHLSWHAIHRELGFAMLQTLWRERKRYGLTGLIPSFGPFRRTIYPLRLARPAGPGAFGYVAILNDILDELELPAAAEEVLTPVLLVYGGRDLLVPPDQGRRLEGLLAASELLVLERDTHLSTPLAPPATERLLGWIDEHQPASRAQ